MPQKINVGVIGATGYTGIELLRLLFGHSNVIVSVVTARQSQGKPLVETIPSLRSVMTADQAATLRFVAPDSPALASIDLVFFATPHGVSMLQVPKLLDTGVRVIDLSADFRLQDAELWYRWYQTPHQATETLQQAVYGLSEWCSEQVTQSRLVANPGCYPTAVQLALWPLLQAEMVDLSDVIVDAKSGMSGAGRQASIDLLAAELQNNFKAYGASLHRHQPEIVQGLQWAADSEHLPVSLTFVPHLLPIVRGIEASIYVNLNQESELETAYECLQKAYQDSPFVTVLPLGEMPQIKWVTGTNHCLIGMSQPKGGKRLLISSVIDNLVKGAAGQAVQNMNLMYQWPETLGLTASPVWP